MLMISTLSSGCGNTVVIAKEELCQDWRIIKPSKADTKETQKQVVGSNEARTPWCK